MAPSQLKQLKASIRDRREANVSKKGGQNTPIRKQPPVQKKKPKSQGEQLRRANLLPELQRRNKAGGIVDRRIGENDPTMAPEERALQRFTHQRNKKDSMFNLEDQDEAETELTHLGRSLFSGANGHVDDYSEDDDDLQKEDQEEDFLVPASKRRRLSHNDDDDDDGVEQRGADEQHERKKTKKEVMEEVIAKSKQHKYERQKLQEEDEDIRETLNKGLPDLIAALKGTPQPPPPVSSPKQNGTSIHPDRAAQIKEVAASRADLAEKEYDKSIRELAQDQRAQPSERTKTAEEKAEEEARRLKELEEERIRRMKGEQSESDDEDNDEIESEDEQEDSDEEDDGEGDDVDIKEVETNMDIDENEASEDGSDSGGSEYQSFEDGAEAIQTESEAPTQARELDVEDEDDFIIDKDLVASGSEIDSDISVESDSPMENGVDEENEDEDDEEFLRDVLPTSKPAGKEELPTTSDVTKLPYTYDCPQQHSELLILIEDMSTSDLPVVIQRIRALYHPQLRPQNNEKLEKFAVTLIDHLPYLASEEASLDIVENVIRHIHSLSRKYPDATAGAFRTHLSQMQGRSDITTGDLFILTAIGSIYPTSDHFHQIVTPAITIMARWLAMHSGQSNQESTTGAYLVALCLKYQRLSKRCIPEAIRYTTRALKREPQGPCSKSHIRNLTTMMDLWSDKSAFTEMFSPAAQAVLEQTEDTHAIRKLRIMLSQARLRRRPLELHHHRPLPIRTSIPKFEEDFDPDKHYDPDRERAESQKLRKEYKREKKGALRELRKDASFIAREKLRQKKAADAAYEAKQRRLIAEIQGEEGREKNAYEREKQKRKARR